jgi:hypothetical protein
MENRLQVELGSLVELLRLGLGYDLALEGATAGKAGVGTFEVSTRPG